MAVMNGIYYDSLQEAINAAGTAKSTIKLEKDLVLLEKLTIANTQDVTIDLNGHSIVTVDTDYTILNNGALTIIDTVEENESSEQVSKIQNYIGIAIHNSGTLTLGMEDETIHSDTPNIIGKTYGIENNGTLNIFDGKITAGTDPIGGTQTKVGVPNGYDITVIEETIDDVVWKNAILKLKE